MGGRSESNTSTQNTTLTETHNLVAEDQAIVNSGDGVTVNQTLTDHGAIEAAQAMAEATASAASAMASDSLLMAENVSIESVGGIRDVATDAVAEIGLVATDTTGSMERLSTVSVEESSGLAEYVVAEMSDAMETFGDRAERMLGDTTSVVGTNSNSAIAAMERVSKSASTNGQSVVADSLVSIFQPGIIGVVVVLFLIAVMFVWRRK